MWLRRRSTERVKHRQGLLRLLGYGTAVGVVCAGFSVRAARAEITDQGVLVGRQMLELANTSENDVQKVILNGQTMFFANSLSDDEPSKVLARYEEHCRANAAQSPESWRELGANARRADAASAAVNAAAGNSGIASTGGVLRGGTRDEGVVLCFVRSATSKPSFGEAMKAFQETGELGALGMLRYVYVKKTAQNHSSILAAWTLDKFNTKDMIADDAHDVPGTDYPEIGRPADSIRMLSASLDGTGYGVNMYVSNAAPSEVALAYDAMMTKNGWFALDIEGPAKRADPSLKGVVGRVYEKDGVMLTLASGLSGNKTITALGLAGIPERKAAR